MSTGGLANMEAMAQVLRGYLSPGAVKAEEWRQTLAEGCIYEDWGTEPISGRDRIVREVLAPVETSFADARHVIDETISDSTRLVVLGQFSGRFVAPYMGTVPTGGEVSWAVRDVWTFDEGRVIRIDIASDTARVAEAMAVESGS
ncbi:MAG: ester cyclase [Actinobacteria bacterium]|nr:ester cyclase [Actinomycetota bacterium]